jgi:uncharacterized membrane protein
MGIILTLQNAYWKQTNMPTGEITGENYIERLELNLNTVINRSMEEVFAVLANLENDLKWRTEWVDARKTSDGPIGLGARFSLVAKAFGKRIETVYETVQGEPNRIAAWKIVSGPLPLTFERVEGGTHITIKYEAELRGFFKLVMSLLARMVKRQHQSDLLKVKELMESRRLTNST